MYRHPTKQVRLLCVAALILCLLLTAGCGGGTTPETLPQETTVPSTTAPVMETQPTQTTEPVVMTDGLVELRQAMVDTPEQLAVAYFDYVSEVERSEVHDYMRSVSPGLCEDLPFLTQIPEDRMVGNEWGDLFCIVPRDPDASIVVMHGEWDENDEYGYTQCIYEWSNGEPILLLCNDEGMDPDTLVTITNPDGSQYTWFPTLNDYRYVDQIYNDELEEQIKDFTAYEELLTARYERMLSEGWEIPTEEDLNCIDWLTDRWLKNGTVVHNELIFYDGICDVIWDEGVPGSSHEYINANWELETVNGYPVLSIDFGEFAGVQRFNVLWNEEGGMLFTMLDVSDGEVEAKWDLMWQILHQGEKDEPMGGYVMDMVGKWELGWTEVDGYIDDSEAGMKTLTITGTDEENLRATLVDGISSNMSFSSRLLVIDIGEVYSGCGNNTWVAYVDYIGNDDLEYKMALLEDDTLLVQMTWNQDGYIGSACAWYVRAD